MNEIKERLASAGLLQEADSFGEALLFSEALQSWCVAG